MDALPMTADTATRADTMDLIIRASFARFDDHLPRRGDNSCAASVFRLLRGGVLKLGYSSESLRRTNHPIRRCPSGARRFPYEPPICRNAQLTEAVYQGSQV